MILFCDFLIQNSVRNYNYFHCSLAHCLSLPMYASPLCRSTQWCSRALQSKQYFASKILIQTLLFKCIHVFVGLTRKTSILRRLFRRCGAVFIRVSLVILESFQLIMLYKNSFCKIYISSMIYNAALKNSSTIVRGLEGPNLYTMFCIVTIQ